MGNVLYDFVNVIPWVQPYIGAGVGMQWVNWQNFHAYNTGRVTVGAVSANPYALDVSSSGDAKGVFAYQGIVGFSVPIPSMPGLAITADYRYLGTSGNRSTSATYTATTSTGAKASGGGNVQFGPTGDNIILVGFRYNFGQTPPPPPAPVAAPAPAVQPARSYLVFFDWDKATLTDRARSIIKEAADNSTHVQYTRIEVNGYTDTSGTPRYNQGLSVRRAQAVAAELVHDGVPQAAITAQGFGETHLLVPTGPGVREPQNRRVEIIIH
jgi:OmpA-OmpF porin, OOP family